MTTDTKAVAQWQFEEWAKEQGCYILAPAVHRTDRYYWSDTQSAWEAWQASLAASRAEVDGLRKDAERWRFARQILSIEAIESASLEFRAYGMPAAEYENLRADNAIDAAMENSNG